ncbi:hypothetical protein PINS_up010085 [Pythium insidiosum]|nr:hypothetical protein PINS_up010085 [Pythium insidiosum]
MQELSQATTDATTPHDDVTRFHRASFPRVQLRVAGDADADAIDRTVALFCGVEAATNRASEISRELDDAIASLAPFVISRQYCVSQEKAPPPVDLRLCFDLKQTSAERINALVERVHEAQRPQAFAVRITSLHPTDYWSRHDSDWEYASTLRVPLSQRTLALDTDWALARDIGVPTTTVIRFREALRWSLQLPQEAVMSPPRETSAGVQHLTFRKGFDDEGMPALCSALPHTQCLESLTIAAAGGWSSFICTEDIVWLGYALFHPDTSASTWRRLRLSYLDYNRMSKTPPVLHMMARGNNLRADWNAPTKLVDWYFTATLRAGAVLFLDFGDDDGGETHTDRLARDTRMDVCVASTDLAELSEMVTVVAPGFGFAFVSRDDIVSIEARAPGRPRLSSLGIRGCDLSRDDVKTILTHSATTLQDVMLDPFGDLVRWRPSRAVVLALLSVVACERQRDAKSGSAVRRLDRDLVTLIASFSDQELCVLPLP